MKTILSNPDIRKKKKLKCNTYLWTTHHLFNMQNIQISIKNSLHFRYLTIKYLKNYILLID